MQIKKNPLVVGISGASGIIYGFRLLSFLLENNYSVELIMSDSAIKVAINESSLTLSREADKLKKQVLSYLMVEDYSSLLNVWNIDDIAASISSGSYKTQGMIIIPASMGTVGSIAAGISKNLIVRCADVCLKERRKLILVPREMPFNTIHLENLLKLSQCGAIIAPASPGFYHMPKSIDENVNFVVGKVLDLFNIEHDLFKRWTKKETIKNEFQLFFNYFFIFLNFSNSEKFEQFVHPTSLQTLFLLQKAQIFELPSLALVSYQENSKDS